MSRIDKFGQTARGPQIDVFEGSPAGLGGTVHLWASPVQGTYERLCDGVRWGDHVAWFDHKPGHGVLACLECFWVFHLDHERSRPRLNAPARSLIYLDSPCPSLGDPVESDTRMLVISLNDLAYFYATADERKDRFIGQFKARCPASTRFTEKASTIFAGSPPRPGQSRRVAGLRQSGSWGRQTPG